MKKMAIKSAAGFVWCIGLVLAGSDSANMPWPNIIGVGLFMLSSGVMTGDVREIIEKIGWRCDGTGKRGMGVGTGAPEVGMF